MRLSPHCIYRHHSRPLRLPIGFVTQRFIKLIYYMSYMFSRQAHLTVTSHEKGKTSPWSPMVFCDLLPVLRNGYGDHTLNIQASIMDDK